MFEESKKGLWWMIGGLAVIAAVIFWIVSTSNTFTLVILFDEIGDLKSGDPVVWKDFTIGKVQDIEPLVENQIGVTIRLKDEYAPRISRGSEFVLRRASVLGLVGKNAIEVVTPATAGEPFSPGEKVQGSSGSLSSLIEEGRRWTQESWQRLRDRASLMMEEFQSSPHRDEAEAALRKLRDLAEEGARRAREGLQEAAGDPRREIEDVLQRLERIRIRMLESGDSEGAGRIREQIEKLRQESQR